MPKNGWGIFGGLVIGLLALWAPAFLLGPVVASLLPGLPVSDNIKVAILHSAIIVVEIGIVLTALAAYGKNVTAIGMARLKGSHLGWAIGGFLAYFALTIVLSTIAQMYTNINYEEPQELGYQALSGIELIAAFVPLVILTPFAEEMIFRGFMLKGFRRRLPFWAATILVSIIFAVAHGQWNVGLDVFAMSIVSCYLVEKTASLWPSIFLHIIKNGVAFYLLYLYNGG